MTTQRKIKKVKSAQTRVIFLDEKNTRVIIGDTIYKREIQTKSRSAYMRRYRKKQQGNSEPVTTVVDELTTLTTLTTFDDSAECDV